MIKSPPFVEPEDAQNVDEQFVTKENTFALKVLKLNFN